MALVTTCGVLASAWSFEMQQATIPGATSSAYPAVRESYLADVSINPGNSGGPVYQLEDAAVVGICVAFRNTFMTAGDQPVIVNGEPLTYNSGLSVVVPIARGEDLLPGHLGS
jgi:S1-C subfamily serine protease